MQGKHFFSIKELQVNFSSALAYEQIQSKKIWDNLVNLSLYPTEMFRNSARKMQTLNYLTAK